MSKFPSKIDSGSFFSEYHTKLNHKMLSLKLVKLFFSKRFSDSGGSLLNSFFIQVNFKDCAKSSMLTILKPPIL